MKIRGTGRIPDYVQIRDNKFMLIAYFKAKAAQRAIIDAGLEKYSDTIIDMIHAIPYGKLTLIPKFEDQE